MDLVFHYSLLVVSYHSFPPRVTLFSKWSSDMRPAALAGRVFIVGKVPVAISFHRSAGRSSLLTADSSLLAAICIVKTAICIDQNGNLYRQVFMRFGALSPSNASSLKQHLARL